MDRRDFLKLSGVSLCTSAAAVFAANRNFSLASDNEEPIEAGWMDDPESRRYFIKNNANPYLSQVNEEIKGTGAGKIALLWLFLEQATGSQLIPHEQGIGDCVSHSYGLGVDILTAIQIIKRNSPQRWVAKAATEIIYGGSRVEIGRKEYGKNFGGDGSTGTLAAEFIKRYGILLRQKYLDKWDFTDYDGQLARQLGRNGVPDELEPLCKIHPVGCVTLVRSWEEARDCIYNGYPITLSSSQGFSTKSGRDSEGFLVPSRRPWMHSMLLAGIDDSHTRPGGLIINSWGTNWIKGPIRHNQPLGSFWADASVVDRMCKQGDSIALSCYAGYPKADYYLW